MQGTTRHHWDLRDFLPRYGILNANNRTTFLALGLSKKPPQALAAVFHRRIGFDVDSPSCHSPCRRDFCCGVLMGDLRNKAWKEAETQAIRETEDRKRNGFTVFHFDFNQKATRRNLTLGEAIRYLMRVTGTRITFWRCPIRGLAIQYKVLPRTSYAYDHGETYMILNFSKLEDVAAAKRELVLDMLLKGIQLHRGLPNTVFDEQVSIIKGLLTAPPSLDKEEWLRIKVTLHGWMQPLLRTHQAELRCHLLGEQYRNPTGPVTFTARLGLPR